MKYGEITFLLPLVAFALDAVFADPKDLPHPVMLLGRALDRMKKPVLDSPKQKRAGLVAVLLLMAASGGAVWLLTLLPFGLGIIFYLYFAYAGLALSGLQREVMAAARAVHSGSIEDARKAVSMLVSRDVSALERDELFKTLAETLSENFNDAFVAPFFWLCLLGPAGLWAYKAASTADSMWGYKHEPWTRAGFGAARMDDIMAYIPARLSMLFLYLASPDKSLWPGWSRVIRDAKSMESPNSGWSMAAAAWLHGAAMGGKALYAGKLKEKPHLGPAKDSADGDWNYEKLYFLSRHILRAGVLAAFSLWIFSLITL